MLSGLVMNKKKHGERGDGGGGNNSSSKSTIAKSKHTINVLFGLYKDSHGTMTNFMDKHTKIDSFFLFKNDLLCRRL